jgi:hypothetical protein
MLHGLKGIFMDKLAGAIAPDEAADQADGAAEAPVRNVTPKLPAESPIEATGFQSQANQAKVGEDRSCAMDIPEKQTRRSDQGRACN